MKESITIRRASAADIPELVQLRRIMFESMGYGDKAQLDAADEAASAYFSAAIPAGEFHGWLAVARSEQVAGSGGIVIDRHPPGPSNLTGQIGYIMNLVTVPEYRKQGVARQVMQTMLAWLAEQGIQQAALHHTDMGRSLYSELGFVDSNEMRLKLGEADA